MLGSRRTVVSLPRLLVALQQNRAASLSIHPDKSASTSYKACGNERHEESLEHWKSIQEGLFSDGFNGSWLQRKQGVL